MERPKPRRHVRQIERGGDETPDFEQRLQPHEIVSQIGHLERQRDEIDSAIQRLRATHNHLSQGVM